MLNSSKRREEGHLPPCKPGIARTLDAVVAVVCVMALSCNAVAASACLASKVIAVKSAPRTVVMSGEYFLAVKVASAAWLGDPTEKGYALRDQFIAVSPEGRFLQVRFEPRRGANTHSVGGRTAFGQEVYYIFDPRRSRIICRRYAM